MIDYKYWICSKDIAEWFMGRKTFDLVDQIDCICSAPHRTFAEKLEGLRELKLYCNEKIVCDKIHQIKAMSRHISSNKSTLQYLYGAEIFYQGNRELIQPEMLFATVPKATAYIRNYILASIREDCLNKEHFYGVVHILGQIYPDEYAKVGDVIVNWKGEGIFYQSDYRRKIADRDTDIGIENRLCLKVPYPSGTIVEIEKNCFFQPFKGILVNDVEPDEMEFEDDTLGQWMIYPEVYYTDQTFGIGIINIRDDYIPFTDNINLTLPCKQFIRKYEGMIAESENWLQELSELVKEDKSCIITILRDRQPREGSLINQKRLKYVRSLMKRSRGNDI